jgi:hypothetical protein
LIRQPTTGAHRLAHHPGSGCRQDAGIHLARSRLNLNGTARVREGRHHSRCRRG